MGKPSIFSRDYNKRMKRRKMRIIYTLCLIIIVCFMFLLYNKNNVKQLYTSTKNKIVSNVTSKPQTSKTVNPGNSATPSASAAPNIDNKAEEEGYTLKLSTGDEVKAVYSQDNGDKAFKYVKSSNDNIYYNISPDAKGVIVFDSAAQSIFYVDIQGNIKDVTKQSYVSSDRQEFKKENIIKDNPSYVWASSPKFIDNTKIAYISQLPWFTNDQIKYIWVVDVTNIQNQRCFESLKGTNVQFDKVTDKGLTVIVDGKTVYLDSNGNITE